MARKFRPKFRPRKKSAFIALILLSVLIGLGAWQMQRLGWKTELLHRINLQMAESPVPLPEKIEHPQEWEYRRVLMAGHFLHKDEFLIKPRTLDGENGYHMLTPFQRASGGIVFVNRGWISDKLMPKAARPSGLLQIEGIVQLPQKSTFTPVNDPAHHNWYWADTTAMAAAAHLKDTLPLVVAMTAHTPDDTTDVWPAGGAARLDIPNDHRQYAIFWFFMAFVLCVIYVLFHLDAHPQ
jgi:surfeit locus 1 family protein